MSASILDAIQNVATPAMIQAATSGLGLTEQAATSTLGAASTTILGGLLTQSGDAALMAKVASLAGGMSPDGGMFANMAGYLGGGLPTSAAHIAGNRLLGLALGDKAPALVGAVAAATGVSTKAAAGLTTLAAPMVLAALRSKLGANPTAAGLTSLLSTDRNLIASAMPPALRNIYGLATGAAGVATVAKAAAPVVAAVAPVAPPLARAATAVAAAPAAIKAAVAPSVAATVAPQPAKPAAPMAASPAAPVAKPAIGATAAGQIPASAAATNVAARAAAPAVRPIPAAVAAAAPAAMTSSGTSPLAIIGLLLPLALLTGLLWYWAYWLDSGKPSLGVKTAAVVAKPVETPKPVEAAKPAPAPVVAAAVPIAVALPHGMMSYTLPGGATIEGNKDGLESKLIGFLSSKDAAIDNKLWFDFDRLTFVTASHDLTPESKAQIATAVGILKAYPAAAIKLGGYTDNQGDADRNLALSESRAQSVMAALAAGGVDASRIEARGYGDQFPIGDNATPEGRAKNRRTALSVRAK